MYLNSKLEAYRGEIKVAIIGCGKFTSMFLSQYHRLQNFNSYNSRLGLKKAKDNCIKAG